MNERTLYHAIDSQASSLLYSSDCKYTEEILPRDQNELLNFFLFLSRYCSNLQCTCHPFEILSEKKKLFSPETSFYYLNLIHKVC